MILVVRRYVVIMDELIEKYVMASINYGKAQEEGDFDKQNKNTAILRKVRIKIKENNSIYVKSLEQLLEHENDYVKLKSAYDLLPILTVKAEKTLMELSNRKGLLGFEAEMILQEWKIGNLLF